MKNKIIRIFVLIFTSSFLGQSLSAQTTAGTSVTNQATVNYDVGGVAQLPVTSNVSDFLVDRSINLTLVKDDSTYVNVAPGGVTEVLTYTLTNTSNDILDFNLLAVQQTTGSTDAFGGLDNLDAINVNVFVDSNGNGTYDQALDLAGFVDELAVGTSVKVFVLPSIPATAVDSDIIGINLQSTAASSGVIGVEGAPIVADTDGDDPAVVENLFADSTGTGGDSASDGQVFALNAAKVSSAALTVSKSSIVISDPIRGTTNPLRIPGAIIRWTITVSNNGGSKADSVVVDDPLDSGTTFQTGTIQVDGIAEDDDAIGADETDPNGADFNVTTSASVTATILEINGSSSKTVVFDVVIN